MEEQKIKNKMQFDIDENIENIFQYFLKYEGFSKRTDIIRVALHKMYDKRFYKKIK